MGRGKYLGSVLEVYFGEGIWGNLWELSVSWLSRLPRRAKKSTPFEQNIYTTYKVVTKNKIEIFIP